MRESAAAAIVGTRDNKLRTADVGLLPAISAPCGFTPERLPIGLQLTGRRFDEATLLRVADAYERDAGWWRQTPPL